MTSSHYPIECRPGDDEAYARRALRVNGMHLLMMFGGFGLIGVVRVGNLAVILALLALTGVALAGLAVVAKHYLKRANRRDRRRAYFDPETGTAAFAGFLVGQEARRVRVEPWLVCPPHDLLGAAKCEVLGVRWLWVRTPAGDLGIPGTHEGFDALAAGICGVYEANGPNADFERSRLSQRRSAKMVRTLIVAGLVFEWFV